MATQQHVPVTVTAKATTTVTVTAPTSKDLFPKITAPPLPEVLVPAPLRKNMVPLAYEVEYHKNTALQGQGTVFPKNMVRHQLEDYPKSMELRLLEVLARNTVLQALEMDCLKNMVLPINEAL